MAHLLLILLIYGLLGRCLPYFMTYNNGARREHTFQTHVFPHKMNICWLRGPGNKSLPQSSRGSATKFLLVDPRIKD